MSDLPVPKDPINTAVEKGVEEAAKLAKDFLDPLLHGGLEQSGGIIADTIEYWRFKNKVNIVLKTKKFLEDKGIQPKALLPKAVMPILEAGSLEVESEMQDRWAALLATHALNPDSTPPAFSKFLSELSSLEAQMLDASNRLDGRHARYVNSDNGPKLFDLVPAGTTPAQVRIALANMIRLGLFGMDLMPEDVDLYSDDNEHFMQQVVRLTGFGAAFIDACTPPARQVLEGEIVIVKDSKS